ncbi:MAG: glutathione S-transferase [Cyanobacteria bacterium P01_D01_bin.105]
MIKLYGIEVSGNTYKVKLLLSLLGLDYEEIRVNLLKGEHKQPEFLAMNPFGQVPLLTDGDLALPDAQAILVYLARTYGDRPENQWLPDAPLALAEVVRWLSTAAGEVRQGPETARLHHLFGLPNINIERANEKSAFILSQLDQHLATHDWLACGHPTIADIAVFPYVALAPDGKISLDSYPQVLAWIERIKTLPNFVGMPGIAPLSE